MIISSNKEQNNKCNFICTKLEALESNLLVVDWVIYYGGGGGIYYAKLEALESNSNLLFPGWGNLLHKTGSS